MFKNNKQYHFWNQHQRWLLPVIIVICAFLIRFIYLTQIQSMPTFDSPTMDEQYHLELANQINNDNLPAEPFFRAPLYPYLLAFFLKITDNSLY